MTDTIEIKHAERSRLLPYVLWIAFAEGVGGLSGWVTRAGSEYFNTKIAHPPLTAPSWVFPIAWAILYALMGIGAARIYLSRKSMARSRALTLFVIQLVVNFLWPILFFNVNAYGTALLWLVALFVIAAAMAIAFRGIDDAAGLMQIPYLFWLGYAAYINAGVWMLTMR